LSVSLTGIRTFKLSPLKKCSCVFRV
jgi:hypothetical protein